MSVDEMTIQNVWQHHFLQVGGGGGQNRLSMGGHAADDSEEGSEVWVTARVD
jgi:hypothetical protein